MKAGKDRTKKPSNKMFMKLFRYISGVNQERQKIEMTTPVLMEKTPHEVNYHEVYSEYTGSASI